MQHHQKSFVSVQGLDIAYARIGKGPPVVYIHGAMTTLDEGLIALGDTLKDEFEIIAFDRPGHGLSAGDKTTGSVSRQADLIQGACEALGILRPVVIGHSFGGAVAMALAMRFPDNVTGVVALAPIAFPEARMEMLLLGTRALPFMGDWNALMARPTDALLMPSLYHAMFLPQAMPAGFAERFPFALGAGQTQLQADGQDALLMSRSLTFNSLLYSACRTPVHVLHGDIDMVVNPLMHARPMAAMVPKARVTSLAGLGHMAHHFVPEAVARAVRDVSERGAAGQAEVPADAAPAAA